MPVEVGATRKEFLLALTGAAVLPELRAQPAPGPGGKLLIVVAHPDDEYAFAATTYRMVRELGWTADQLIVTDGESGNRYATLAETYYDVPLTNPADARIHLAAIRKQECLRAGKVLGIRRHYFLEQRDLGFNNNAAAADASNWDREFVLSKLSSLLEREHYDVVFTLLPTAETHGHHRAATLLALEAIARIADASRPLVFGAEPRAKAQAPLRFSGWEPNPLTVTTEPSPVFTFDRLRSFGFHNALTYDIVVNWLIAEHKSQGLFQTTYGTDQYEQFWLFRISGAGAGQRASELFEACNETRRTP
ncbi:MAG TPA: PIG-L family deacetylase [Bryobacteraceae bacterium]|nr:PIG-L family deacetylase [Bryobacteraceae bacterium]